MSAALKLEQIYTYEDYAKWDDSERWELIDGYAYAMAAPIRRHQSVQLNLGTAFRNFLKGKKCQVFMAPFDVMPDPADKTTVLQPDLLVVCDTKKLANEKNCQGAPDLVIEVLSPSSYKMDTIIKLQKYQQTGVHEYWIVDPQYKIVDVYLLQDGMYHKKTYYEDETVPVRLFEEFDFQIPGADIFDVPEV